jgi:hypothetical protein
MPIQCTAQCHLRPWHAALRGTGAVRLDMAEHHDNEVLVGYSHRTSFSMVRSSVAIISGRVPGNDAFHPHVCASNSSVVPQMQRRVSLARHDMLTGLGICPCPGDLLSLTPLILLANLPAVPICVTQTYHRVPFQAMHHRV